MSQLEYSQEYVPHGGIPVVSLTHARIIFLTQFWLMEHKIV